MEVHWRPPPHDWLKINMDDSLSKDWSGYGAILRNEDTLSPGYHWTFLPSIFSKLKAIEMGIWMAISAGVTKLWIKSNSTTALAWIKGNGCRPWSSICCLRCIHQGLDNLTDWIATHIHHEGNIPPDLLASHRSDRGETILFPSNVWTDLQAAIDQDKSDIPYVRKKD
ncbi:hypothetical protein QJS04_geneDACA011889 [Acorus gramineus]|uniref:RNase H type-1 domain-containing protein n=1 Tax=Acorus gramineus TaxID=55184 RepID=A0AAV9AGP6_ACOGR|nr:hypothetical protein QJS04_geneDACA011889 [Acorus gramineus]